MSLSSSTLIITLLPMNISHTAMTLLLATLLVTSLNLVNCQISTPCTTSMISTFTPCANYITGSTNNGATTPPSTTCCDSLRSLMSNSMDCACLVISANAPIVPLPISQALALSLARACNINGVSAQCKAPGSRLPPPGPAALGSNILTLPPIAASPLSPQAQVSKTMDVSEAHKYENLQLVAEAVAPSSSSASEEAEAPTKTPGIRPVLTPSASASHPSFVSLSPFALIIIALMVFGTY